VDVIEGSREKIMWLNLYPDEEKNIDTVGDDNYLGRVRDYFGKRCLRGTALLANYREDGVIKEQDCEPFLRKIFSQLRPQRAVEIGTLFGVTTALLAHYSKEVITIDVAYQQVASYIKYFFGVADRIHNVIVQDNEEKKEFLTEFDFDFAFIDAIHTYEAVKFDFECVRKCGRVLFHDYSVFSGITRFVNELPKKEIYKASPFAYWEAK